MTEDVRKEIMHALLDTDKKLMEVNISKAISAQFEPDDLDEMLDCGMSTKDVVNYINEKKAKLDDISEELDIAKYNLSVLEEELEEMTGGNYNDQT